MSDTPRPTAEDLARQARQHLESLRAAGVEWLPNTLLQVPELASPPPVTPAAPAVSLFAAAEAAPVLPVEQRRQALVMLAEKVAGCTRCTELASKRTQTVFGVGKIDAELCFIGEAPGADEDRQGEDRKSVV